MKEPITIFGTKDATNLMSAFHGLGNELLTELLRYYSAPHEKKSLRTWKMKDACEMIGRSEAYIRKLEKLDSVYKPPQNDSGARSYPLDLINKIREKSGTRYHRPTQSDPIIISISNFKGGVAKSTTSLHLAHKAAILGLRVLAVDLDPQATLTLGFGYVPDIDIMHENTIRLAMTESSEKIKDLRIKTYFDGIDLIPSNLSLSDLEIVLTDISQQETQARTLGMPNERLINALSVVKDDYDIIVLDCGPNLGMLTINAVTASNSLLVPIPPMMSDFGSFVTFTGTLESLFQQTNKNFEFFRILITKHPESKESKQLEIMMREKFGNYILQKFLVNSVEIEKAASTFSSVYELPKKSAPAYKRAMTSMDGVMNEIFDAFKKIWYEQSVINEETA